MKKVMIIDDNQTNLKMLDLILTKSGFRTDCVVKPEFALELIKETKPNLILLDVNMPVINGFQLCKQIKKELDIRDIPIIFVSALSDVKYIAGGLALGAVDYITKPIKAEEVVARVSVQMELAKSKKKLEKENAGLQTQLLEKFDLRDDFLYSLDRIRTNNASQTDYTRVKQYLEHIIEATLKDSQYENILDLDFVLNAIKSSLE